MKCLCVDDDEFILAILQGTLAVEGYSDVTTAESGASALLEIENAAIPYSCFFLDIQMPGMSGIELCERIRQNPIYQKTPIIMLTAMTDRDYIDRAFRSGATDYITKPFDILELGTRAKIAERLSNEMALSNEHLTTLDHLTKELLDTRIIDLAEAIHVDNIQGLLEKTSFENYITTLSRGRYYSSNLLALKIENIDLLHKHCNTREFDFAIADISEAISDSLSLNSGFFSYFGGGIFVCVYSRVKDSLADDFGLRVEDTIAKMNLIFQDGLKFEISLRCGPTVNPSLFSKWGTTKIVERAIQGLAQNGATLKHGNLH